MLKRRKPVFYILEENPVYREIIPKCLTVTVPESQIRTFEHPAEMLDALGVKPDLLVSEYSFSTPGFDGRRILDIVHKESPQTRVIFLTAHSDILDAVNTIQSGALDYIPKSKNAFDQLIKKLLAFRKKIDYVHQSNRILFFVAVSIGLTAMVLATLALMYHGEL